MQQVILFLLCYPLLPNDCRETHTQLTLIFRCYLPLPDDCRKTQTEAMLLLCCYPFLPDDCRETICPFILFGLGCSKYLSCNSVEVGNGVLSHYPRDRRTSNCDARVVWLSSMEHLYYLVWLAIANRRPRSDPSVSTRSVLSMGTARPGILATCINKIREI